MKFIGYFCLYIMIFIASWDLLLTFGANASISSWIVAILSAILGVWYSNREKGKHDK